MFGQRRKFDMSELTIETFILGPDEANCYLVSSGSDAVVFDVGVEPDRLIARIEELGLTLRGIYVTHFHLDHIGGVQQVHEHFGAPVFASRKMSSSRNCPWRRAESVSSSNMWAFRIHPSAQGGRPCSARS